MGPRLFVFGGFDPLAAGRAAARARRLLLRACRGGRLAVAVTRDDEPARVAEWRRRATETGFSFETLDVADPGVARRCADLDLLHVPAGHTAHLLHHLRGHADALRAAWEAGLTLSGTSGGGAGFATRLWSASRFGEPEWIPGLGFVPLALSAHFDQPRWARPRLPVDGAAEIEVLALDDDAMLDWTPDRASILALRPGAGGHRLRTGMPPEPLPARDLSPLWGWLIRARRSLPGGSARRL